MITLLHGLIFTVKGVIGVWLLILHHLFDVEEVIIQYDRKKLHVTAVASGGVKCQHINIQQVFFYTLFYSLSIMWPPLFCYGLCGINEWRWGCSTTAGFVSNDTSFFSFYFLFLLLMNRSHLIFTDTKNLRFASCCNPFLSDFHYLATQII